MRTFIIISLTVFFICCNSISLQEGRSQYLPEGFNKVSIRQIDFKNLSFPPTKNFKGIKLINSTSGKIDGGEIISLQSIVFENVNEENEKALVTIRFDDGNATNHILHIFHMEENKLKLLQSFEFLDEGNISLATSYFAHNKLIIETYNLESGDAQCCPSIIKKMHYQWINQRFNLVSTQRIPNNFVERIRKIKK